MININLYSDIKNLKSVLLKRPGVELENLYPDNMNRLLFDDIPYLKEAQYEHDIFAETLRKNGVEVIYLDDLLIDVLEDVKIRENFISDFVKEAGLTGVQENRILDFLRDTNTVELRDFIIGGIRKDQISSKFEDLHDRVHRADPFYIEPMPNLYFSRDYMTTIGRGVSINTMTYQTRKRETLLIDYIFKYHKDLKHTPIYHHRNSNYSIEGGDILVLSDRVIAIGISERTNAKAIEELANNIFSTDESFEKILAFVIPKKRAFMHLDTVFTMVDYDAFTVHPEIEEVLSIYELIKSEDGLRIKERQESLEKVLASSLGLDSIRLIRCANGARIASSREQWNDASNTLAIKPGEVVVYERNNVTNELLDKEGIKLHLIRSSELSRGRGGPRCMSMPLIRE